MQPDATPKEQPSISPEREMFEKLEQLVGSPTFNHWFRGKTAITVDGHQASLTVDNVFLLSWIQRRFRSAVQDAAHHVLGATAEVKFLVRPTVDVKSSEAKTPDVNKPAEAAGRSLGKPHGTLQKPPLRAPDACKPTADHGPVNETVNDSAKRPAAPASNSPPGRRFADLADFVKGPGNELALTAALQICEQPGTRYNPLVLYGGVGTGKTHLLEAIYRRVRARHPGLHLMFLSAEGFANYFTQALRDHSLPSFRHRFRNVDVLMVDDVDFLDGKRVIQEEFLHTVRQLESHERQIVLSADRHPRLLTKLSEELVTRFIAGIVCRMEAPDLETRREIVARKAARLTGTVSEEALEFVAQRFKTSVRELEGALHCLETYALMSGKSVCLSTAGRVLADLERDCVRVIRLADVEQAVCRVFSVEPNELRSPRRSRSVSQPRMLAMYLARKMTQAAYSEIGEYFGGRNHSTVMSAEKRIRDLLASQVTMRVASQNWKLGDLMSSLEQQLLTG